MRMIIKSIIKSPLKNAIYVILLTTAFAPIVLLLNTYFISLDIMRNFTLIHQSLSDSMLHSEYGWLFNIEKEIQLSMSSLLSKAVLLSLLCLSVLPFLQYLLSFGHGYEIGVLRALGMGKGRVWVRLFFENILLMVAAIIITLLITLVTYKYFAFSILVIDFETEQILMETFGTNDIFRLTPPAILYALIAAGTVTLISSVLSNILIANSEPLLLIRKYK